MGRPRKARKEKTKLQSSEQKPKERLVPAAWKRVVLEGISPHLQSFNLPHDVYCEAMGECFCSEQTVVVSQYSKADQQIHKHSLRKKMNAVLTIGYKQRVAVTSAALSCPEVKAALNPKARRLRVRS